MILILPDYGHLGESMCSSKSANYFVTQQNLKKNLHKMQLFLLKYLNSNSVLITTNNNYHLVYVFKVI